MSYAADEQIDEFARLVAVNLRRLDKEKEAHRKTKNSKQQEESHNLVSH